MKFSDMDLPEGKRVTAKKLKISEHYETGVQFFDEMAVGANLDPRDALAN